MPALKARSHDLRVLECGIPHEGSVAKNVDILRAIVRAQHVRKGRVQFFVASNRDTGGWIGSPRIQERALPQAPSSRFVFVLDCFRMEVCLDVVLMLGHAWYMNGLEEAL
ncbi:hypothetical protein QTI66_35740 [Variovorax sp. J22R133]|uniref:hypothetical protein n=1 Tax=Variovorax brevis TaxID=3053503 RepID=UPI002578AB91|nr:hypothetical protein [Variovorax sp. J22R133]MDM0117471.1 hypothetical protein [Variovorax sp. J22R133]